MTVSEEAVFEKLKNVIDPELFVNVVDLGLIYEVKLRPGTGAPAGAAAPGDSPGAKTLDAATGASGATAGSASSAVNPGVTAGLPSSVAATASNPSAATAVDTAAPGDSPGAKTVHADAGLSGGAGDASAATAGPRTDVLIEMTMTSPACPAGPQLISGAKREVASIDGVGNVEVKIVLDPPWTPDRMTEDAKDQLGIF